MQVLFYINRVYRRIVKGVLYTFFSLFGLFITAFILLQLPIVQNYVADQIVKRLSRDLQTEVSIDHVRIGFSNFLIEGFYIEDQHQDTLLYSGKVKASYNALKLLSNRFVASNISLTGTKLNVDRKTGESEFNYQFVIDAFAGSQDKTEEENPSTWKFDIGTFNLQNLSLTYNDQVLAKKMKGTLQQGHIAIDRLSPAENSYVFDELVIDGLIASIEAAEPEFDPPLTKSESEKRSDTEELIASINPGGFAFQLKKANISNITFTNRRLGALPTQVGNIDYNDIEIKDFLVSLSDVSLEKDTLFGKILRLEAKEKSGFRISELEANLRFSNNELVLDELNLATGHSVISNKLSFQYSSLADLADPINNVKINANFDNSEVATTDLAYFIPGFDHIDESYTLSGEISGRISNLKGKHLALQYGDHTILEGGFTMFGLPKIDETFMDVGIENFETTADEFQEIFPFVKLPANTKKLGKVKFNGNFAGFVNDFVAYGDMQTALGFIRSDINMKTSKLDGIPHYSGSIITQKFKIGRWLGDEQNLGNISLNANIEGKGFTWDKLTATMAGNVNAFDLNGYTYNNITFDGELKRRFFSGQMAIADENLNMNFTGTVDFQADLPVFDLFADIKFARLQDLNLTDKNYKVKSKLHLDFVGSNINNTEGIAYLTNTEFYSDKKFYYLDTVSLSSTISDEGKVIDLQSGILDASLEGQFNTKSLPGAVSEVIRHYYPAFKTGFAPNTATQDFSFDISVKNLSTVSDMFLEKLTIAPGSKVWGHFDYSKNKLDLHTRSDFIQWENIKANGINLNIQPEENGLSFQSGIDKLALNQNLYAQHELNGKIENGSIQFHVAIQKDSITESFKADATLEGIGDSMQLSLLNSRLTFAGHEWNIEGNNLITFIENNVYAENLQFVNGEQSITVNSREVDQSTSTDLNLELKNLNMAEISSLLNLEYYKMDGRIDGTLLLNDLLSEKRVFSGNLLVDSFHFNNNPYGQLSLNGSYNPTSSLLNAEAIVNGKNCMFTAKGNYVANNKGGNLDFNVNIAQLPFNTLEIFMKGVASDLSGSANGNFKVSGQPTNPQIDGNIRIANAGMKVDYLNSHYYFEPVHISLTNNSLFINKTVVRDGKGSDASKADVGGEISFTRFSDFRFDDFYVYTDDNFRFMETTIEDNDYFYGSAYGKGIILINGPFDDLNIYVNARTDPNTKIYIPIAYETSVSKYDFIRFIDKDGDSADQALKKRSYSGLELTMDLDVTPDAEVQLIFDLQAGDIIKGRGEGNLNLNINTFGDFSMYGSYTIQEGDYLFTLQDIINKKFEIEKGGTIAWSGDPYEAQLDINAIYTRKASRYDLVMDLANELGDDEIKRLKKPVPVEVHLAMKGVLSSPDISFDIVLPSNNGTEFTSTFNNRLLEVKSDENELSKQVFGLIVFNRFIPVDIGGDPGLISGSKNTVTEFLTNQLNIYFNDWLSKYEMEVNVDYRSYQLGGEDDDNISRNELELELVKRVGRLYFNIGGNIDFGGEGASYEGTNAVAGDFSIEYSLREDGRIRVKVFRTSEYDIFSDAYRNKGGVGIFITKEFDNLEDLLSNPDKQKSLLDSSPDNNNLPGSDDEKVPDKDVVDIDQNKSP